MFAASMLARPDQAIDPINDGRHQLVDKPHARESIPYLVTLPEEGIAFFVYTWVDQHSCAGAALAIFGPGVNAQDGNGVIQQRLADRPVPADMNFSDWKIDGLSIAHDLQFANAKVRWEHPQAVLDFTFSAFHPPYAYGSHQRGCPEYVATNRIEQSGRVQGTLTLGERVIKFDTTGHRDHSWGTRDWKTMQHYKWFVGQSASGIAVHFWELQGLGRTELRGYVFKDNLMAEVTSVSVDWNTDAAYWQTDCDIVLNDEAGRTTTVHVDVIARYPLVPDATTVLNEGCGSAVIDGQPGVGWLEVAWPTDYLAYIAANKAA